MLIACTAAFSYQLIDKAQQDLFARQRSPQRFQPALMCTCSEQVKEHAADGPSAAAADRVEVVPVCVSPVAAADDKKPVQLLHNPQQRGANRLPPAGGARGRLRPPRSHAHQGGQTSWARASGRFSRASCLGALPTDRLPIECLSTFIRGTRIAGLCVPRVPCAVPAPLRRDGIPTT